MQGFNNYGPYGNFGNANGMRGGVNPGVVGAMNNGANNAGWNAALASMTQFQIAKVAAGVDANGNTVDTSYWTLDTEYGGSVTVNATSGTPIATSCVSPLVSTIPTPTNTSVFFSKTGEAGTKPPVNYAFQTFIVD